MLVFLALSVAALQAATFEVEAANKAMLIFVNGQLAGQTPLTIELDDGSHGFEFEKEEWQPAAMQHDLAVEQAQQALELCPAPPA